MSYQVQIRPDQSKDWFDIGPVWEEEKKAKSFYDLLHNLWVNTTDELEIDQKEENFTNNARVIESPIASME